MGGFQRTLGHSYLFTVLSYLSSKLPERTLSCLLLDLACFGSLFYFIYLFFGGFGFLHLTEQALALAEWGDLAEHCFPEVHPQAHPIQLACMNCTLQGMND